jgi:hypothetical protein
MRQLVSRLENAYRLATTAQHNLWYGCAAEEVSRMFCVLCVEHVMIPQEQGVMQDVLPFSVLASSKP